MDYVSFPVKNPLTSSPRLRAICVIQNPFACVAIPAISTRRRQVDQKQYYVPGQSPSRPYFNREEVRRHQHLPLLEQEFLPRSFPAPFRRRLQAVFFENVRDCAMATT